MKKEIIIIDRPPYKKRFSVCKKKSFTPRHCYEGDCLACTNRKYDEECFKFLPFDEQCGMMVKGKFIL